MLSKRLRKVNKGVRSVVSCVAFCIWFHPRKLFNLHFLLLRIFGNRVDGVRTHFFTFGSVGRMGVKNMFSSQFYMCSIEGYGGNERRRLLTDAGVQFSNNSFSVSWRTKRPLVQRSSCPVVAIS